MAFYDKFPYTNFQELNLDWIIKAINELKTEVENYIEINAIKYADPLLWDIRTQYTKNTVVLTESGNAYLSVQPVPTGVNIDNTDYWTEIGNFSELWNDIKQAITDYDEGYSGTAGGDREVNDLVWLGNSLYVVTVPMTAGAAYLPGTNCLQIDLQEYIQNIESVLDTKIDTTRTEIETGVDQQITTLQDNVTQQVTEFTEEIQTYVDQKTENLQIQPHVGKDAKFIYVSDTAGNDDNTGLTRGEPVKTFNHAVELINGDGMASVITVMDDHTYTYSKMRMSGVDLHIVFEYGARLNIEADSGSNVFYRMHLNITATSAKAYISTGSAYFEGVHGTMNNIGFLGRVHLPNDCHIAFTNCRFTAANDFALQASLSRVYLRGTNTLEDTGTGATACFEIDQSFLSFDGTLTVNKANAVDGSVLIRLNGSQAELRGSVTTNTNNYTYRITIENTQCSMTSGAWVNLVQQSGSQTYRHGGGGMFSFTNPRVTLNAPATIQIHEFSITTGTNGTWNIRARMTNTGGAISTETVIGTLDFAPAHNTYVPMVSIAGTPGPTMFIRPNKQISVYNIPAGTEVATNLSITVNQIA